MKTTHLLSTAALCVALGAGAAAAQGTQQHTQQQMPDRAPTAQQNAPAEKSGPALRGGAHQGAQTTGQGQSGRELNERSNRGDQNGGGSRAQDTRPGMNRNAEESRPGMNKNERSDRTGQTTRERKEGATSGSGSKQNARENERSGERERATQRSNGRDRDGGTVRERETTTGQGAGRAARLSPEQRTRITTIIKERNVQPARINVPVRVGVRVPRTVQFYPLPPRVIEVYPEWRGYDYILVSGQILIIDPDTYEIVAVLPA
jgi:hypothetical protein